MTVTVETYTNPREWKKHPIYHQIKNEIHLCATSNVAKGIKERYQNNSTKEFQYVLTIHKLFTNVFWSWNQAEYLLEQYLTLSKLVNDLSVDGKLKQSFLYNLYEVQNTIRLFAVCNLSPESLFNEYILSKKEKIFKRIWEEYESLNDDVYMKTKLFLNRGRIDKGKIVEIINKIFKKENSKILIDPKKDIKIVLHGFYFLTPEQQVFLKFLERSGFELMFFQYYEDRFENTFSFIRKFICEQNDWTDNWNFYPSEEKTTDSLGVEFLKLFEKTNYKDNDLENESRLNVVKYHSFFDFLERVIVKNYPVGSKTSSNDISIVATNADILNSLLVQYYPEHYSKKRNFLSYPVGQFLLKLHQMYEDGKFIIDKDILMSLFSSGWLHDTSTGENARDYLYELKTIYPFFEDCKTLEEWFERMEKLVDIYNNILPLFNRKNDNRVVRSVESPFTRIGYLSLEKEKVIQIQKFILILKEMIINLFDLNKRETSIQSHFDKLLSLMKEYDPKNNAVVLKKAEKEIIDILQFKLEKVDAKYSFMYKDLTQAISFYLSGKFEQDEDHLITPFIEIDGEVFKKREKKVFVTGLDELGLPFEKFSTPWPFNQESFEFIASGNKALNLHVLRNESINQISRYLMYLVLRFTDPEMTEYSWIENFLDRKDLGPTIYLKYLEAKVIDSDDNKNFNKSVGEYNKYDFSNEIVDKNMYYQEINDISKPDFLIEYTTCPKRFYYGIILDKYTVFIDNFFHRFMYGQIIKLVKGKLNLSIDSTKDLVKGIFPQFSKYTLENLTENYINSATPLKDYKKIDDNIKVLKEKIHFQFPLCKNKVLEKLSNIDEGLAKNDLVNLYNSDDHAFVGKPGKHCTGCPFKNICFEFNTYKN